MYSHFPGQISYYIYRSRTVSSVLYRPRVVGKSEIRGEKSPERFEQPTSAGNIVSAVNVRATGKEESAD